MRKRWVRQEKLLAMIRLQNEAPGKKGDDKIDLLTP